MEIQNSNDSMPKKWPDSLNSGNHLGSFNINFHLCFPILGVDFTLRLLSPGLSLSRTPGPCSSCSSLQCASQSVQLPTREKIKLREAKEKQIVEGIKWGNTVKHNETEILAPKHLWWKGTGIEKEYPPDHKSSNGVFQDAGNKLTFRPPEPRRSESLPHQSINLRKLHQWSVFGGVPPFHPTLASSLSSTKTW